MIQASLMSFPGSLPGTTLVLDPAVFDRADYYLDDSAPESNTGAIDSPIPAREWVRRVAQPWPAAGATMNVHLLGDVSLPFFDATWIKANNNTWLTFTADTTTKPKLLDGAVLTGASKARACVVAAESIVFDSVGKTATQATGDFVAAGFYAGQLVVFFDSALNTSAYTVTNVTALALTFGGDVIVNETVTTQVVGVGGRDGTISTAGIDFTALVGKIGKVIGGAHDGATFVITKDLGGGVARVGNVSAGSFDNTGVALAASDVIDVYDLVAITSLYQQIGSFDFSGVTLQNLAIVGGVNLGDNTVVFFDGCEVQSDIEVYGGAQGQFYNCSVRFVETYGDGVIYLYGGSGFDAVHAGAHTLIAVGNWTLQGSQLKATDATSILAIASNTWCAVFDTAFPAVLVTLGGYFSSGGGSKLWGQGINSASGKIQVNPGGSFSFDVFAPNLAGTGPDVVIVATAKTFGELPFSLPNSAAFVYERTTGA